MRDLKELALPIGRVLIAVLFLVSGVRKLGHPSAVIEMIGQNLPFPTLGLAISLACELGAGTLLMLGFRTRAMALVLAAFTLATALVFHNDFAARGELNNFMKNIAILGGLLHVFASGGGRYSLDALHGRRAVAAS